MYFDLARQLVFPTSFQIVKTIVKDGFFQLALSYSKTISFFASFKAL